MKLFAVLARRGGPGSTEEAGDFPNITAPSGSASFTVDWDAEEGADGYLVYVSTTTQTFADESLYAYRYKASGQATEQLVISSVAAGTYYVRVAAYIGTTVLGLSFEVTKTAA
jgi:hypothetical protein